MTDILVPGVGYTTFRQIFIPTENRRVKLTIPDYQRSYDWRTEHRVDLFTDLERLAELAGSGGLHELSGHFCGTLICTPVKEPKGADLQYDVVDGQQRMTTLVLLHGLLARTVGGTSFVVSGPNSLFEPQKADANFFRSAMSDDMHGKADTIGQQHYRTAIGEIKGWIEKLGKAKAVDMLRLVEERLQFIFFVLKDSQEVSKVFETINNRGKPLTQLDLVKNHLIYMKAVHSWDGDVDTVWTGIQQLAVEIGFRGGEGVDTVLRAVVTAMFQPGRRNSGETDHEIVKRHIHKRTHYETFGRFLSFLEIAFKTFRDLRNAYDTGKDKPVQTQLTYLNQHPSISGVLPLVLARQFCRKDDQGADVLAAIEKANFRLYGLMNASKKSNSHHVPLHRLAHKYFQENCHSGAPRSPEERRALSGKLIADLTSIVTEQHKDGFGQIVRALTLDDDDGADFYHWEGLRYFLARWEESLMKRQSFEYSRLDRQYPKSHSNDYLAREHIYPSSTPGALAEYKDGIQLRRLGNFMLLPQGVNSSLSNGMPKDKIAGLDRCGRENSLLVQNKRLKEFFKLADEFRRVLEARKEPVFGSTHASRFNQTSIKPNGIVAEAKTLCDLREEQMVSFALEAWRMPGEELGEREGERFLGVFSFRLEDETYLSDKERPATKENANYVLQRAPEATAGNARLDRLVDRLVRRNEILGYTFEPVSWPIDLQR